MRWIETDTASNQNISSATAIGAYTADADRLVIVDVQLDAVAGNGDYVMYVTKQINGAGSAYVILPKTTMAAASGETAIAGQSGIIAVKSGDVLTVYVDGLAGDTTTPDYYTRWFEIDRLVTLADDAITEAKITAGAVTEIQTGLALEATLSAIKGAGWSTETLVKIVNDIAAISAGSGATAAEVWTYALRTLTGFTTTEFHVIGPVRNDGKIDALAGDDYYAADGRGMVWSDTAWPDLTGATVNFISGSTTIAMSVVTAGTGEQTVNLDVPKATSLAMKGEFKFIIQATLTNGHVATLLEGEGRFR